MSSRYTGGGSSSEARLAMLRLVTLCILVLGSALCVDALELAEAHPIACATSSASPLLADCEPLVNQLYTRARNGLQCLNNNGVASHCTTLLTNGGCDVALCGSLGDPSCAVVGAVAQAIITTCTDGTLIGGATDITGFIGPNFALLGKQTVEIINHAGNGKSVQSSFVFDKFNATFSNKALGDQYQVPNTAYSFFVEREQNMNEVLSAPEANQLQTVFYNNYLAGGNGRTRIYGSIRVGFDSASADVNLYLDAAGDNLVSDFSPAEVQAIIEGINNFRNQQGNPGWFAVALLSAGVGYVGTIIFQLVDFL